uniref:Secreted protein n=1 Tax=Oryza brachyantha TaxID=4533 RepID=J3MYY2_ORYBR
MILPVAWPSMLFAQASCALLRGYVESMVVLSFPCLAMSTSHSISSFLRIRINGTSLFLENVTLCRNAVAVAATPGLTSTTAPPASARTSLNVDHGAGGPQCATASYFFPDVQGLVVERHVGAEAADEAEVARAAGGRDVQPSELGEH